MPKFRYRCILALILFGACITAVPSQLAARGGKSFSSLPLVFERNRGQAPASYQFLARHGSMQALFSNQSLDIILPADQRSESTIRIRWDGTDKTATIAGGEPLPGRSNYLLGPDPAKWLTDVPQFAQVRYRRAYPNIDLEFHGRGNMLEHDFVVNPGADVSQIAFSIDHPAHLTPSGDLVIHAGADELHLLRPVAYQGSGSSKTPVSAKFWITRNGQIRFKVGKYDHHRTLVIDPVFAFSTYLAGSSSDYLTAVTTDPSGNVYVAGYTTSPDFPVTNASNPLCTTCASPAQEKQGFVSKLDPTGHTLLYSTFLGGSTGGGFGTFPSSVRLDASGNIYVAGVTSAWDFPHAGAVLTLTPQNFNQNYYFVASLKPDGSAFNYSGLVGGEEGFNTNGTNGNLAVDSAGNAYLAGTTYDSNFQLTSGTLDSTPSSYPYDTMFVLKLDATGRLVYSTLVPGNATRPVGTAYADNFVTQSISVDGNGQVTAAGTAGIGLPVTSGVLESTIPNPLNLIDPTAGFLLQLNAGASALNFATYLPGTDGAGGLVVDQSGNFYITGSTSETDLPVSSNAFQKNLTPGPNCSCNNGYVLKINGQGTAVLAGTYLSGTPSTGNEGTSFTGIALDSQSNVAVGGMTASTDFPLKNPFLATLEFSSTVSGLAVAELNPDLSALEFGSYLSSPSFGGGATFSALTFDSNNNLLIAGTVLAVDFPTTANAFQKNPPVSSSGPIYPHPFISKLDLATAAPSVCLSTTGLNFGAVLVGTPSSMGLGITNCGNAALQISSVASNLASFVPGQNCVSIPAGNTCTLQVTFTPADTSAVSATLTLTDNAAIPAQTVTLSGKGGSPQVYFPPSFTVNDIVLGTQSTSYLVLNNVGDGNWIDNSVTAPGDFSIASSCTSPVPPSGFCVIGIAFAPTQVGLRTGTLTISDNVAGSPHVIQLSGNSFSIYTTPSISSITALPTDAQSPTLRIYGNNFFPASQVMVNGSPRVTSDVNEESLSAQLTAADIAQPGELSVTIVNPTPDGGVSNSYPATIYNALRNIAFQHAVYDPNSGHIYASVSTTSANHPNQVVVVDPASAQVIAAWGVGNGPNQLAVSDDGQFLYVGLDGDKKVAQVALPAGTINFAVGLGNERTFNSPMIADALRVLPGQPHSWAVTLCATGYTPCGNGVAVFDDNIERATLAQGTQLQPDSLIFVGSDATKLYGTTLHQGPPSLYEFAINSSGITLAQTAQNFSGASPGGGTLDTDGTSIYVSNGQVIDPSTLAIKSGQFTPGASNSEFRVDVPSSRVYFAGSSIGIGPLPGYTFLVQAFDLATQQLTGQIFMPEFGGGGPPEMYRWGSNDLEVGVMNAMLFLRTSLTNSTAPAAQFYVSAISPEDVPAGNPDLAVTIQGSGFSVSDSVTANGVALHITSATANQIAATIPASLLSAAGDVPIAISDATNHVGYLDLVVSPQPTQVGLSTKALTFAAQNVGTSSTAQTVILTDTGTTPLSVSSVSIIGDFSQTNNCATLAPAGTCAISVIFAPSAAGTRSGTLQIDDSDASKSQTVTLAGMGSDVQISGSGGANLTATAAPGQSATYSLSITPEGTFTGPLTFSCSNLPAFASCGFNPASAMIGSSAVSVTVTISTVQQSATVIHPTLRPRGLLACLSALFLLSFGPFEQLGKLQRRATVALLIIMLVALPVAGCGGGGSSSTVPLKPASTPAGTYTITFTATDGAFSRSVQLNLVVTN